MNVILGDTEHRKMERLYEGISPFELKNKLIDLAQEHEKKSTRAMLDAGRGNPNWLAAAPREAFFALGQFAVQECRLVWNERDLAGKPLSDRMADRFAAFVRDNREVPGIALLNDIIEYGVAAEGFSAEQWLYELVDGIIGDNYPMPDRMLVHTEKVVQSFLQRRLFRTESGGKYDLFAVEGATAAMCYIFDSLLENYLLSREDKIAVMVPVFPPYLEIPHLARYGFEIVEISATGTDNQGNHTWQYPPAELDKLKDPEIKALFLVNPSNPPSVAVKPESVRKIVEVVKYYNPNLMIISDDVYGTFVDNYQSLIAVLPFNTVGVYSFSK